MSYAAADEALVNDVVIRLRDEAGLRPFFDEWRAAPLAQQTSVRERALERSRTVAVCFGPQGQSTWHDHEMAQLALILGAESGGRRLMPVLLPGALPEHIFGLMRMRAWVDLGQSNGFARLVTGIVGRVH